MAAKIIDGTAIAAEIRQRVKARVEELRARGQTVRLAAVLIGQSTPAEMYAARQADACAAVGIRYDLVKLPSDASQQQACEFIDALNRDPAITGIMLHLPAPAHIDTGALQQRIDVGKDVEGVNPMNLGLLVLGRAVNVPCTALAAFELIRWTGITVRAAEAVVVGASPIVGKPLALLLSDQRATVHICRSATRDLPAQCSRADILVAALGRPQILTAEYIKPGAVVIDVGINRVSLADGTQKTVGDVDFEAAREKALWITPVPGGVGPMTVAMLLSNTVTSAERAVC